MATKAPSQKKLRWLVLYGVTGIVDLIQIIIDFTGVGIAVSEAIELAMPFVVGFLLLVFRMLNFQTGLSVAVAVALDAVTGGLAPFWVGDIYYIQKKLRATELAQTEAQEASSEGNPMNTKGVRLPRNTEAGETADSINSSRNPNTRPLNIDGVRQPRP